MSVKVEKTDKTNELKLEFTIEAEKFEEAIQTVYKKSAKYFNIPGFRKGKAPFNIVERHYGKEIFYEDAFNEVVPSVYENALKENKIEAVSRPTIDIKQMERGKELIFTATVQTKPEVKLGKYKGIEIKKIEYNVSDEDIQKELERMAEKNARLVSIDDRAVEDGDITVIDFEGFCEGKAFEGGKAEKYELKIGSKSFIEGFEEQVIGMKIDEEKEIKVKFPDEYFSKDLEGKDAVFKVKLHEIKKKELPAIDDELAKDISEFETLKELKDSIKEKLEHENADRAKFETEEEALKAVTDGVEIEIPSGMIETETENIIKNLETRLYYQGISLQQYLQMIQKTMAEFKKEHEEEAKRAVKVRLVLEAICKDAKIELDEKEFQDKLIEVAKNYGKTEEDVKNNEEFKKYVEDTMKIEKTIAYIIDNAKIK